LNEVPARLRQRSEPAIEVWWDFLNQAVAEGQSGQDIQVF
jgi:hypothetical protein